LGQRLAMMPRISVLACCTSMVSQATPRACARPISTRSSADPIPRPCQASATTTATSAVDPLPDPARSTAMACPMITPPSVATSTSAPAPPARRRSIDPVGVTAAKNLRYRVRGDSPAKNSPSAARSVGCAGRIAAETGRWA